MRACHWLVCKPSTKINLLSVAELYRMIWSTDYSSISHMYTPELVVAGLEHTVHALRFCLSLPAHSSSLPFSSSISAMFLTRRILSACLFPCRLLILPLLPDFSVLCQRCFAPSIPSLSFPSLLHVCLPGIRICITPFLRPLSSPAVVCHLPFLSLLLCQPRLRYGTTLRSTR